MGLFGGSKSYSGSGQKWARKFAEPAAASVQSVFNQNQPQLQNITKGVTDLLPGISQQYSSWSPLTQQSQGYYGDVMSGKFLDPSNNPGLAGVLDRTRRDVTGGVNSNYSMAGRYGSFAHDEALSRGLADAENAVLMDNYNRERAMQDQAAAMPAQMQNQNLAQLLQASGVGAELPYTGTNSLASSLAALFSGGTQKQSGGIGGMLAGGGAILSGLGAMGK